MATATPPPNYASFHRSISEELNSTKNRIRDLVTHWGTDGEWKEASLKSILRRHLPQSVIVGRGFVVGPDRCSTQVDILIVDSSKPTLFRDGDLLIVTPDAVRGIIEVKTELRDRSSVSKALRKLSKIESMCHAATRRNSVWTGLFIFTEDGDSDTRLLGGLGDAHATTRRPINCISCGTDSFVRLWRSGNDVNSPIPGPVWHTYKLPSMAPSYFLGNLVDAIGSVESPGSGFAWFPMIGGKEQYKSKYMAVGQIDPRDF